jgi:hypothetical protein
MTQQASEQAAGQGQTINVNVSAGGDSRYTTMSSDKSRKMALILCAVGGMFGVHQFYVGRIGMGIAYFLDSIKIWTGSFKDNAGAPLREW